ncbi:hypothetical protein [Carp edema virus]|nr:hypothetical protein [Carp edema virus]
MSHMLIPIVKFDELRINLEETIKEFNSIFCFIKLHSPELNLTRNNTKNGLVIFPEFALLKTFTKNKYKLFSVSLSPIDRSPFYSNDFDEKTYWSIFPTLVKINYSKELDYTKRSHFDSFCDYFNTNFAKQEDHILVPIFDPFLEKIYTDTEIEELLLNEKLTYAEDYFYTKSKAKVLTPKANLFVKAFMLKKGFIIESEYLNLNKESLVESFGFKLI